MLKVNEIFYSIQGEGFHTGRAAIFVRFAGCNLKCSFCDTKHENYVEKNITEIVDTIASISQKLPISPMLIFTGGEPFLQDNIELKVLLKALKRRFFIAFETNGTIMPDKDLLKEIDWVTVSPKEVAFFKTQIKSYAHEFKIVVGENVTKEILDDIYNTYYHKLCYFFLQPESNTTINIQKCISYIKEDPRWALSLQMQNILSIQ